MKKTLEFLKILFKIFIIIEIMIAIGSVLAGVIFSIGSDVNVIYSILFCFLAINSLFFGFTGQIIILFYKGLILYPLIYLKVFIIIFFIIFFFKLRKRFNNKIAFKYSIIPMIIIFALYNYFFRTIPDYSSKTHERIVTLSDYKKYQQGYCLKEDRILPKDELYKRVVINFLKTKRWDETYKHLSFSLNEDNEDKINYYIHKDFNLDNYKEFLKQRALEKEYFSLDELQEVDYSKYLTIDAKNNKAGFIKPVILANNSIKQYYVYLDDSFYFKENTIFYKKIHLYTLQEQEKNLDKLIKKFKNYKDDFTYGIVFDNCGNF
ncbi:hypothetical protein AVBRAN12642_05565 [Campylobacter sp. RM12642]|uniref:hypothetical protein n=1 Tax=unclassified Campylobacter TaxID=2593542 RepID=UPI001E07299D|nr:hypothetical protein [Campylobacter sp. RM12642]MBZ8007643.1 hypothetical protein [Campylobacter sp. RM9334]